MAKRDIVCIAASLGGIDALCQIIRALPAGLSAALRIVQHRRAQECLPEILTRCGTLSAHQARHQEPVEHSKIYVAPPDHHMRVGPCGIQLDKGPKEHYTRPAADPLFRSAAQIYCERVVGIVLTGGDADGAEGLREIKAAGGVAVVQDPKEAIAPEMPISGLRQDTPDYCLAINGIAALIKELSYQA